MAIAVMASIDEWLLCSRGAISMPPSIRGAAAPIPMWAKCFDAFTEMLETEGYKIVKA